MKTAIWLCFCVTFTTAHGMFLTDLDTSDRNTLLYQQQVGDLIVGERFSEPARGLDCILTLDANDLQERLGGLWLNIENSTSLHWSGYRFDFYDSTFTQPFRLPLNSFFLGPNELLPERSFLPNFNTSTISLEGGSGVDPGQFFTVILTFNIQTILEDNPSPNGQINIGVRQIPQSVAVPDSGETLGLLCVAGLGILISAAAFGKMPACSE